MEMQTVRLKEFVKSKEFKSTIFLILGFSGLMVGVVMLYGSFCYAPYVLIDQYHDYRTGTLVQILGMFGLFPLAFGSLGFIVAISNLRELGHLHFSKPHFGMKTRLSKDR